MKLWVRSENGEKLVLTSGFFLTSANFFNLFGGRNGDVFLAAYITKDKALAQLDDIQEYIMEGICAKHDGISSGPESDVESRFCPYVYDLREKKIK